MCTSIFIFYKPWQKVLFENLKINYIEIHILKVSNFVQKQVFTSSQIESYSGI